MVRNTITVFFRERPFIPCGDDYIILHHRSGVIQLDDHRPRFKKKNRKVVFQYRPPALYFDFRLNNQSIFVQHIKPAIHGFLRDRSSGLAYLAYGQTGSGKTHTLVGNSTEQGLIQNTLRYLLLDQQLAETYNISVTCLEIYNEHIYDLLDQRREITVRESNHQLCYAKPPYHAIISNWDNLTQYMKTVGRNKMMGETKVNQTSSRSHTIYKFTLRPNGGGIVKTLLYLDLAGTERGKYSLATGKAAIQEYTAINQSLFSLKECIRAINQRQRHIPYRRSKLTMLLKDIFFRQYHLHFIANLNPSNRYFHDMLDTLRYATNLATSNIEEIQKDLAHRGGSPLVIAPPIRPSPVSVTPTHPRNLTPYHRPTNKLPGLGMRRPKPPHDPPKLCKTPTHQGRHLIQPKPTPLTKYSHHKGYGNKYPNLVITGHSPKSKHRAHLVESIKVSSDSPSDPSNSENSNGTDTMGHNVSLEIQRPSHPPPLAVLQYYNQYILQLHKISRRDHRNYEFAQQLVKSGQNLDTKRYIREINRILDQRISFLVEAKHRFRDLASKS